MPLKSKALSAKKLAQYEATRDLGAELLQSIREMKAGQVHVVHTPVTEARQKTGLSQSQFAALLGVFVRTLQGWEQGRKQPSNCVRSQAVVGVEAFNKGLDFADALHVVRAVRETGFLTFDKRLDRRAKSLALATPVELLA